MEMFSTVLAFCEGKPPPSAMDSLQNMKGQQIQKCFNKQSIYLCREALWRSCRITVMEMLSQFRCDDHVDIAMNSHSNFFYNYLNPTVDFFVKEPFNKVKGKSNINIPNQDPNEFYLFVKDSW